MSATTLARATPCASPASPAAPVRDRDGVSEGYTVQQVARLTGLSEHTLRYYERARLLDPVRRQDTSRHRRYSADDVARLRTLACLRAAGMPLAGMRRYFELLGQGASVAPLQQSMLTEQRGVIEGRIRELEAHLRYLDDKIAYWQAVGTGDTARAEEIVRRMTCHLRTPSTP